MADAFGGSGRERFPSWRAGYDEPLPPPETEEPGLFQSFLGLLGAPMRGIEGFLYGLPEGEPFGTAWKSITGEEDITGGHVLSKYLGGSPYDWRWPGFAADIALDPLTYTGFGAATKIGRPGLLRRAVGGVGESLRLSRPGTELLRTAKRYAQELTPGLDDLAARQAGESALGHVIERELAEKSVGRWGKLSVPALESEARGAAETLRAAEARDELLSPLATRIRDALKVKGVGPLDLLQKPGLRLSLPGLTQA